MAIKPLNSVGGFSVGEIPANIILANGDITASNATFEGNILVSNATSSWGILTDNLYYSNGVPWDLQEAAGSNSQVQFNDNNNFGASANFTFDTATNLLTITGNIDTTNIVRANYLYANANVLANNVNANSNVNVTGNLLANFIAANANIVGANLIANNNVYASSTVIANMIHANANIEAVDTITGNLIISNGNVNGANLYSSANISAVANILGNFVLANANVVGNNLLANANVVANNVQSNSNITANVNLLAGNVISNAKGIFYNNTDGQVTINSSSIGVGLQGRSVAGAATIDLHTATNGAAYDVRFSATGGNASTGSGNLDIYATKTTFQGNIAATNANIVDLGASGNLIANLITSNSNVNAEAIQVNTTITANGNITGNYIIGNGHYLTGIDTAGLQNGTSNIRVFSSGNIVLSSNGVANVLNVTDTGAIVTGQLDANTIVAGNITSNANVITDYIATNTGPLSITADQLYITATAGNIDVANTIIANVGGPIDAHDAATKEYVDNAVAAGLSIHTPVYVETPAALTATYADGGTSITVITITSDQTLTTSSSHGLAENDLVVFSTTSNGIVAGTPYFVYTTPAPNQFTLSLTYNGPEIVSFTNGSGLTIGGLVNAGVGATLTNSGAQAALEIDGVTLSAGQRVLVYRQTNQIENGIYTVTDIGSVSSNWELTRASDADTYAPNSPDGMSAGDYFFIQAGDTGAGESYVNNTVGVIVFGTTNITFAQFADTQVYTAGTGLGLNGTQFYIANTLVTPASYGNGDRVASFTVNQQGQLTAASDVVITANAGNLSGTTLNATVVNSSLTSVGNLTVANVTGNLIANNVISNNEVQSITGNFSGNVSASNFSTTGSGGNISGANVISANTFVGVDANLSGNVISNNLTVNLELSGNTANFNNVNIATQINSYDANISNTLTAGNLVITGTANIAGIQNGTSNVHIDPSGNVNTSVAGTANVLVVTSDSINVAGNVFIGNTSVAWATLTTTSITANQTIANISVTGVSGFEFLVKGVDASGAKYSVATVQAVTNGTSADYSTYGGVTLGGYTGSLAVNVSGGYLKLQVTPASTNSTVWTTQIRFI